MTVLTSCPNPAEWQVLLDGNLSASELATLNDHLEQCESCQQRVETLSGESGWCAALASPERHPVEGERGFQQALEELNGETGGHKADTEPGGDDEMVLDFLSPPDQPGQLGRLGHYAVLEVIGRGGGGVVLKALDEKLRRVVAIKVMAPQLATNATARQRFKREGQAAASIRNEHVISIYAVEEAKGLPFLVMEYISGVSLQEKLDSAGPLELTQILRIGMQTAAGLAAAHAQGVIHRDIKPANILLENSVERVKLTDFGLARAFDDASLTQSGVVAGTPQYMAPEQARGDAVDARADLFSLGSVLYALCTGHPPFRAGQALAVLKRICDDTPRPIQEANPDLPPWLCDIIARLHAKEPGERFASAAEVADLLGRHLAALQHPGVPPPVALSLSPRGRGRGEGSAEPIATSTRKNASAASWRGRWWRGAGLVLLVALAPVGIVYAPAVYRLVTDQGQVVIETDDPDVKVVVKQDEQEVTILDAKTKREITLKAGRYQLELSDAKDGLRLSATEFTLERGGREIVRVRREPAGLIHTLVGHKDFVWTAAFCLDGRHVLSAGGNRHDDQKWVRGSDFGLRLWDALTGTEVARLDDHTEIVHCVAVSPDGRRAVSAGGDSRPEAKDYSLRLWDLETRKLVRRFRHGHTGRVACVVFSADGKRVFSASDDRTVRVWDVETGQEVRSFKKGETDAVWSVDVAPDGKRVLSGNAAGIMRVWNAETGDLVKSIRANDAALGSVTFSPDGRFGLTQGGHTPKVWDLATGTVVCTLNGHWGWTGRLAFSPDGRRILSGSADRTVRLWDAATGRELHRFEGHGAPVYAVAFSRDGRRAVSASWDKTVRIWKLPE